MTQLYLLLGVVIGVVGHMQYLKMKAAALKKKKKETFTYIREHEFNDSDNPAYYE